MRVHEYLVQLDDNGGKSIRRKYMPLSIATSSISSCAAQLVMTSCYRKCMPTWLTSCFIAAGMHINDSKAALGSKRDRHDNIGRGLIGIGLFERLMNDPRLDGEHFTVALELTV